MTNTAAQSPTTALACAAIAVALHIAAMVSYYPVVQTDGWCGEFSQEEAQETNNKQTCQSEEQNERRTKKS